MVHLRSQWSEFSTSGALKLPKVIHIRSRAVKNADAGAMIMPTVVANDNVLSEDLEATVTDDGES